MSLTDKTVKSLTAPAKGQITYWDKSVTGFGLRVSQGGSKSFVVVHGANRRRTTLGRYPVISLSDARTEAKRLLAELTLGKTRPANITVKDAINAYLKYSEAQHKTSTHENYKGNLKRYFSLGRMYLSDVTPQEIMRCVNKLNHSTSVQNQVFVVLRAFFNWCVSQHYLQSSPLNGMSLPNSTSSRDRYLNDKEINVVFNSAITHGHPFGTVVALLLLTGQRRGEVAHFHKDWVNFAARTITIPDQITKNKRQHTFPFGKFTESILKSVPMTETWYFPASRSHVRGKPTTVMNGWAKGKAAFDDSIEEDLAPWTLHDLRRTYSSTMAKLGTPIHVTERLINHTSGSISGVAAVYNRYDYMDEMRTAVAAYEAHLQSLLKM